MKSIEHYINMTTLVFSLVAISACAPGNDETDPSDNPSGGIDYKTLTITVKDATDDTPLDGVSLKLVKSGVSAKPTGTKGVYEFNELRDASYDISAEKTGYIQQSKIIITDRDTQETEFRLIRDVSVEGIIKTTDGQPLSNAYVYLVPTKNNDTKVEVGNGSDNNGWFSFSGLSDGATYQLFVFKEGYKSIADRPITIPEHAANGQMIAKTVENISFDKIFMDFGETTDMAVLNINTKDDQNQAWQLACDADWISFDIPSGTGNASIILEIDRNYLSSKNSERIARILVTAGGKSDEMWIIVSGAGRGVNMGDIITLSAKDITSNSATVSSIILTQGIKENAKQIGVCYSYENKIPTYERDDSGQGELNNIDDGGQYTVSLDNLIAEKTYYVRAFVIDNNNLIHYSPNVRSFSTKTEVIAPKIIVSSATNIKSTSATLNANILHSGTPIHCEIGFCYSKTNNTPTVYDTRRSSEKSQGNDYHLDIDGLDYRAVYYVRGYAIQNGMPIYSDNFISFTTSWISSSVQTIAPTNIGASSAILRGSIIQKGDPTYGERGFCINKTGSPTIIDKRVVANTEENDYSLSVSNLDYRTTYYVRAYIIQNGETQYGDIISFTTIWEDTQVNTYAVTDIEANAATFNGVINNPGQPECYEYGFVYSRTNTNPTIGDSKVNCSGNTSSYSKVVTGLSSSQTYYVKAYAIQPGQSEPAYGTVRQFTTGTPPEIQTLEVNEVWKINQINGSYLLFANLYGKIINPGSAGYVERGFVYKVEDILFNTPPVYENDIVAKSPNEGIFTMVTYQLNHIEWYVVRAYVKTASGTVYYGGPVTFDTFDFTEFP